MSNLPMPEPGFTVSETEAFDCGVKDGEQRGFNADNPYNSRTHPQEFEAWETGFSVGVKNNEASTG